MVVGIEIDRGLVVWSLLEAGYEVYAINPMASARYRDRHATSGAKSDPGDAKVLADLVRTDRHNHRPVAGDSDLAEGVKLLARAHQSAIWGRQRQVSALRSSLRGTTPGLWWPSAPIWPTQMPWPSWPSRPTPELGRGLSRSKIASALRKGGRQRNIERRSQEIQECPAYRSAQGPRTIVKAHGVVPIGPDIDLPLFKAVDRRTRGRAVRTFPAAPGRQGRPIPARTRDGPRCPGAGRVR